MQRRECNRAKEKKDKEATQRTEDDVRRVDEEYKPVFLYSMSLQRMAH